MANIARDIFKAYDIRGIVGKTLTDDAAYLIGRAIAAKAEFEGATEIITIDGLRVEFPDGFGLMRASNTTPILVLRFEADTQAAIERIQNQFKAVIESNPNLIWPL